MRVYLSAMLIRNAVWLSYILWTIVALYNKISTLNSQTSFFIAYMGEKYGSYGSLDKGYQLLMLQSELHYL